MVAVYNPVHFRSVEKGAGSVPDDNQYLEGAGVEAG